MKSTYVGRGEMAHMIAAFESNFTGGDLMKNLDAPQPVGNFVTYYSIDEYSSCHLPTRRTSFQFFRSGVCPHKFHRSSQVFEQGEIS